jgi:hypothetical protein
MSPGYDGRRWFPAAVHANVPHKIVGFDAHNERFRVRHTGESRYPGCAGRYQLWISAYGGMTTYFRIFILCRRTKAHGSLHDQSGFQSR